MQNKHKEVVKDSHASKIIADQAIHQIKASAMCV